MLIIFSSGCKKGSTAADVVSPAKVDDDNYNILITPWDNMIDKGLLEVMDKDGNVIHQRATDSLAYNLEAWNISGKKYYSYGLHDPSAFMASGVPYTPSTIVITDSNLNEIKRLHLQSYGNIDATSQHALDPHDFIMLGEDHYIAISYFKKTVNNIPVSLDASGSATVIAPIIQEVNAGTVIWQWDGSDYPEFYGASVEGNAYGNGIANDYLHLNSITIDPKDNNLICSFRNANEIIKISRMNGSIVWRLGSINSDFALTSDQVFLRQHFATLTDNNQTLILFDNGETTLRPYSRILEFQLDEVNKKVTGFKSYNIPMPFSMIMGSVQKHGNNYFIGGGSAGYVLDINYITGVKDFELDLNKYNYRALRTPK